MLKGQRISSSDIMILPGTPKLRFMEDESKSAPPGWKPEQVTVSAQDADPTLRNSTSILSAFDTGCIVWK